MNGQWQTYIEVKTRCYILTLFLTDCTESEETWTADFPRSLDALPSIECPEETTQVNTQATVSNNNQGRGPGFPVGEGGTNPVGGCLRRTLAPGGKNVCERIRSHWGGEGREGTPQTWILIPKVEYLATYQIRIWKELYYHSIFG